MHARDVAITYDEVLLRNFRAARAAAELDHGRLAARMQALGYNWTRQTVSKVERRVRAIQVEEILGLSLAMETTIGRLMAPTDEDKLVELPSGAGITVEAARMSAFGRILHYILWDGDTPRFPSSDDPYPAAVRDALTRPPRVEWAADDEG